MLGLPRRRDAQIEGGAQRHGHGAISLSNHRRRPEQFVEQVAEPCLEHVDLGLRDRHARGPVVGDGPGRDIMLRRPAKARPGLQLDVKIVGQDDSGADSRAVFAVMQRFGTSRQDRATSPDKNSRILRHSTLRSGA